MALLRALGAGRRQVLGSVLLEALLVGLVAAVIGLAAGIGLAIGVQSLLKAIGVDLPTTSTVIRPNTILVPLVVGVVVMVLSAIAPALRTMRSEEHTSELQSLMRISYAVFRLQQTNHCNTNTY